MWGPPPMTLADPTTVRSAGTGAAACVRYVDDTGYQSPSSSSPRTRRCKCFLRRGAEQARLTLDQFGAASCKARMEARSIVESCCRKKKKKKNRIEIENGNDYVP